MTAASGYCDLNLSLSLSLRFNGHFSRWTWNVSILDFIGATGDGGGEW